MIWALCVVSLRWLIHAYLFFEKIVVHSPQTPSLQQKVTHTLVSSPTLEIIRVKLLRCIYILREIMCMYICVYATTHTHIYTYIVYFDYCSSLYLPDVIFLESWGWESCGTLSFAVDSWGKGRQAAIVGSSKSSWKDLHSVFGHCFLLLLQLSERNINYRKLFQ